LLAAASIAALLLATTGAPQASAQGAANQSNVATPNATSGAAANVAAGLGELSLEPKQFTSPEGLSSALQVMILLTVISLAPAIMLMTTSFIRIVVVLGLLRQALGTQQLPPSQVITTLAMFMTIVVMLPTWKQVYDQAIAPYTSRAEGATLDRTWTEGIKPIRKFMSDQIARTGNDDDVRLFLDYLPAEIDPVTGQPPHYVYYGAREGDTEVPLAALLPAFMLSELKTAFLIGFRIYLPFLILDLVVASVTTSMGMLMLPPALISLPFKILLFVLLDGWNLVVRMLMESFVG
jgi:flagellar biosynthetic protein FliP